MQKIKCSKYIASKLWVALLMVFLFLPINGFAMSFNLIETDGGTAIDGYNPISENTTIDLSSVGQKITITAESSLSENEIGSVVFNLQGPSPITDKVEKVYPYVLTGDNDGIYNVWTPEDGSYILEAEAFNINGDSVDQGKIEFIVSSVAVDEEDNEEIERPEGWSDESHGKKADPNYEKIFPSDKVNRLDISISKEDWQAMMDNITEVWGPHGGSGAGCSEVRWDFPEENPIYKPSTVTFEGNTWNHVGIRFKGNSSLQAAWDSGSYKLPFRLNFDKFEDEFPAIKNQRFFGFDDLGLSNTSWDNSLLREKVGADIFRESGVPAPHTAFYRVYIDYGEGSKYFGLYTLVEVPDKPMLESQFTDNGGNLYKPTGDGATFSVYDEAAYQKETNEKEADFTDVRALYDALHADRTDPEAWRAHLEEVFNVDGFLHWLAVNTTVGNWDSYGVMAQNYFLYNDPADTRLHWIAYDFGMIMMPVSLKSPLSLELTEEEVGDQWPLIRYLIDDPVYKAIYVAYVRDTVTTIFTPDRMQTTFQATHDMIAPYVVGEQGEVDGYTLLANEANFERSLNVLSNYVQNRYEAARSFIGAGEQ